MSVYDLKNIAILNAKGDDFRRILWGIGRDETVDRVNNSALEDKSLLQMVSGANKTPVEVTREGAFGGTYFRSICFGVTGKWYKKSWKEFNQLKNTDQKLNMVLNAEHR